MFTISGKNTFSVYLHVQKENIKGLPNKQNHLMANKRRLLGSFTSLHLENALLEFGNSEQNFQAESRLWDHRRQSRAVFYGGNYYSRMYIQNTTYSILPFSEFGATFCLWVCDIPNVSPTCQSTSKNSVRVVLQTSSEHSTGSVSLVQRDIRVDVHTLVKISLFYSLMFHVQLLGCNSVFGIYTFYMHICG